MKKKILSLAILMSTGVFAYANISFADIQNNNTTVLVQDDSYKTVELTALPDLIQEIVKKYEVLYTIETLAYNEAELLTKFSLVSKADGTKKEVVLDKDGKELETEVAVDPAPEKQ